MIVFNENALALEAAVMERNWIFLDQVPHSLSENSKFFAKFQT
jgi:hypothetical protein